MDEPAETHQSLIASAKRLAVSVLALAHNRLELLLVELQEERFRVFEALLLIVAVATLGALTLGVLTFTVVVIFWENHRLAALGVLGLLYLLATVLTFCRLRYRLRNWSAFPDTLAELRKDKAWLQRKN